jgi:predicted transcriptional regulator
VPAEVTEFGIDSSAEIRRTTSYHNHLLRRAMTAVPFSLRLDPELKEAVEKEARLEDRSASFIIQQATREYVERKERFRAMLWELEDEFISSGKMRAWVASWGSADELPSPEPDVFPASREWAA